MIEHPNAKVSATMIHRSSQLEVDANPLWQF
jgi:hypothetical protein